MLPLLFAQYPAENDFLQVSQQVHVHVHVCAQTEAVILISAMTLKLIVIKNIFFNVTAYYRGKLWDNYHSACNKTYSLNYSCNKNNYYDC